MTATPPDAEELRALLDDALAATALFARDLGAEFAALESDDPEALAAAATAKQQSLGALEGLEARRCQWLRRCGEEDDAGGMERVLATLADSQSGDRWQAYLAAAADCRRVNLTNGAIIRLRQQQVGAALRLLAGAPVPTYGPAGNEQARASRPLAQA